ncbi:Uma2 family endonuclease [Caminibacter sp.]
MSVLPIEYYTYEDYKKWEGDWELIYGMPYAMAPAPVKKHQLLASNIIFELKKSLECENCEVLGEVDYKINEETVLRPDVVLTCDDEGVEHLIKAPEIIFEIISPSTARRDEIYKFKIYEKEGVDFLILVYPDDLVAKIYKNIDGEFKKKGDFSRGVFDFGICGVKVDFGKVFEKYRK